MSIQEKLLTNEEFREFVTRPENADRRFELIDGEVVEMAPSSKRNTAVAAEIIYLLKAYVREHKNGVVTATDGGYEVAPGTTLIPDGAYFASDRLDSWDGVTFLFAPDLAVEVISPKSESPNKVRSKVMAYLNGGTRLVWAVYPEERELDVWQPSGDGFFVRTLRVGDALDGGEVLPGFSAPLADIFPD
jgi:Uma2 family endonuclease